MYKVFGFANHDAHYIHKRIKFLFPEKKCQPIYDTYKVKKNVDIIFCFTVRSLIKISRQIEDKDVKVFVFDSPYYLNNIENLSILDVKKSNGLNFSFIAVTDEQLISAIDSVGVKKIQRRNIDVVSILESKMTPSCLSFILTFLYSIQNTEKRNLYKKIIFSWFFTKKTSKWLAKKIKESSSKKQNVNAESLIRHIENGNFDNLKQALSHISPIIKSKLPINYDAISKKFNVAAYDLRYITQNKYGTTDASKVKEKTLKHKVINLKPSK